MKIGREGFFFKFILFFYNGYKLLYGSVKSSTWFPEKPMLLALIVTADGRFEEAPSKKVKSVEIRAEVFQRKKESERFIREGMCKN